ncbi:MAG: hypothetical protein IAE88_02055, partial [Rhodobacteraceae bacterium]|nr:hypothetical protein [Paracoccaceae bacterium]
MAVTHAGSLVSVGGRIALKSFARRSIRAHRVPKKRRIVDQDQHLFVGASVNRQHGLALCRLHDHRGGLWMRNYHYRLRMAGLWVVATMPLVFGGAFAQSEAKKPVSQVEQSYQAGDSSPVGDTEMHHNINPKAPPMTKEEFEKAKN